ncbi:MAG: N-formylglutamate amidohydrolase [Pseudomonadota bacterium]
METCFDRLGPTLPESPVIVSVPHAGRDYPPALLERLRVPLDALLPLEDRHVDTLAVAACTSETLLIARRPRAWIDLNRGERDRDPRVDEGASAMSAPILSTKVRGGLGLIPRRAAAGTEIWARRWTADEVTARIMADHRPYHAAIADALAVARARFGVAILLDLHSMPPLAGDAPARLVIGDRFGRSAAARFVGRIEGSARRAGVAVALNTPYAGGHILERHAAPGKRVHAIQLEVDRALYLDAAMRKPGAGFDAVATLLRDILDALADEACPLADAAE